MLCDQYDYISGFPEAYMVDIYNAMDVLANPAMAEGFGAPIIEAMACGTPVIATAFSAMTEIVEGGGGWLIHPVDCERFWSAQGAWQVVPHVDAILRAMEWAWEYRRETGEAMQVSRRGLAARARALKYDFGEVVAKRWDQVLREMKEKGEMGVER